MHTINVDKATAVELSCYLAYQCGWRVRYSRRQRDTNRRWFVDAPDFASSALVGVGHATKQGAWDAVMRLFNPTVSVDDCVVAAGVLNHKVSLRQVNGEWWAAVCPTEVCCSDVASLALALAIATAVSRRGTTT